MSKWRVFWIYFWRVVHVLNWIWSPAFALWRVNELERVVVRAELSAIQEAGAASMAIAEIVASFFCAYAADRVIALLNAPLVPAGSAPQMKKAPPAGEG